MTNIAGIGKQPCEPAGHSDEVTPDVGRASLKLDDLFRLRRAEQQSQTRMVPGESLPNRRASALREGPTWKTTHSSVRPTRSQGADAPVCLVARDVAAGVDGMTRTLSAWSQTGRQPGQQDPGAHRRGAPQALAPRHPGGRKAARRVCEDWLNYFAVPGSSRFIRTFHRRLQHLWIRVLRRRSQRARFGWKRLEHMTEILRTRASTRHPWPDQRFAANHPRQEPDGSTTTSGSARGGAGAIRIPTVTGLHKALPYRTRLRSIWK